MALPATPSNLFVQTGNGAIYLSWDIVGSATSYTVQRSTDNVTFATLSSPTINNYTDTTASYSTQYWYKVASVNGSGTSSYTASQGAVLTPNGEMCLSQIRLAAQQRADRVNSDFVSLPEWNSYINQSLFELYDLLITAYQDYFVATPWSFTTDGSTFLYPLPTGINYSGIAAFYKLMGVDLGISNANNAYVTIGKFNFRDRNTYVYPNSASTIYGVFNLRYRLVGANIEFIPTPTANQSVRVWYVPKMNPLVKDTDTTIQGISGWTEYVIVDAAIKALQKEESDVSVLMAQKMALIKRIEETAITRDEGQPDTITDVRGYGSNGGMGGPGWPGPIGGW